MKKGAHISFRGAIEFIVILGLMLAISYISGLMELYYLLNPQFLSPTDLLRPYIFNSRSLMEHLLFFPPLLFLRSLLGMAPTGLLLGPRVISANFKKCFILSLLIVGLPLSLLLLITARSVAIIQFLYYIAPRIVGPLYWVIKDGGGIYDWVNPDLIPIQFALSFLFYSLVIELPRQVLYIFILLKTTPSAVAKGLIRTVTRRTSGALALTLASILLLSGLWCMLLSPTTLDFPMKDTFSVRIQIDGLGVWSYPLSLEKGDILFGFVNGTGAVFNVDIYNPDGNIVTPVYSEANVSYSYFIIDIFKSGSYRLEVQNREQNAVEFRVQITVHSKVTVRPLEPLGQWLSLVSLPIYGLGIWASGVFTVIQKKEKKVQ